MGDPKSLPEMAELERMLGLDKERPAPTPDDDTPTSPELGQYVEAERETSPSLGQIVCPTCRGAGRHLRVVETPSGYRSKVADCDTCKGSGYVAEK